MHLGETLLVLGALVIFSVSALYLNDAKFDNDMKLMETEFRITAVGIAQSFIEEAQVMEYDEVLINGVYNVLPDDFTAAALLGSEDAEFYPNFDDVDDFNSFTQNITTPRADYSVTVQVSYADTLNLNPGFANPSFFKIMTVTVKSIFFQDSIFCDYLFSFH